MKITVDATAEVELYEILEQCSLGQLLKEIPNVRLDTADYVGLGLFLSTLYERELRDLAYGIDNETAKRIIEAFKFYGKG